MSYNNLIFEQKDQVGVIKINRPKAMNALNQELLSELNTCLDEVEKSNLRCLIITGEGKAFVAGADIKEMENYGKGEAKKMADNGQALFDRIENLNVPSIAAVNGFALGGGLELAMACDFIIASEKAKVGLPEVTLGLIPGYGGTQRLARYVGKAKAKMMIMTGDIFKAEEAMNLGLVAKLVSPDDLMTEAEKLAATVASRSPSAIRLVKEAVYKGYDAVQKEGMAIEAELFSKTFETDDHVEGIKAFIEKRAPEFTGK